MGLQDLAGQLPGMPLTTAEITYRMLDFWDILQTYIWQDYGLAPRFPKLAKFLDFWLYNLDGHLATIRVAQSRSRDTCVTPPCQSRMAPSLSR
jgi:uncharacterized protein Usg